MGCLAKKRPDIKDIGKSSIEFYKDGKPQYYCYGYIDQRTDGLIEECKQCSRKVYKAQEDLDRYIQERERGANNEY